jgi:ABC-type bacteriocin/lantibiotic exporter with double-glycine peptidase domain
MARNLNAMFILLLGLRVVVSAADPLNLWIDVPFVKQEKNGCGPASIAMVMQYWQQRQGAGARPASEVTEIERALQPDRKHGVLATQMVHYFEQNGYKAFAFAGQWADLEHEIANGRPVIAALKPEEGNSLHYVVLAGMDEKQGLILLNDPAQRKLLSETRNQFEREWKVTGYWMLLAVPQPVATDAH